MRIPWDVFEATAKRYPDQDALIIDENVFSFRTIHNAALENAQVIVNLNADLTHPIAIELVKSPLAYCLILACLRLGVPYVCLDPTSPSERRRRQLNRIRPCLLFTSIFSCETDTGLIIVDPSKPRLSASHASADSTLPSLGSISPTDPVYFMFTSGSTGEPKGAVIHGLGILEFMTWGRSLLKIGNGRRLAALSPLHFDNSVFDIYCGLLLGASLIVIETAENKNPASWVRKLRDGHADTAFAIPTLFLMLDQIGLLTPEALPSVKTFLFGGEGYPSSALKAFHARFAETAKLINVYGPTETTCICSSIEISKAAFDSNMPFASIGKMHDGFRYQILDENNANAATRQKGELWIGGPCVSLGYYRNTEETNIHFAQNPTDERMRDIWYRTGDIVSEDENGRLWFHGRADNQVKIRGHRIELEEIDKALETLPAIRRALSGVIDVDRSPSLFALYVADDSMSMDDVRAACANILPPYMTPKQLLQVDELPTNDNGKADRRRAAAYFTKN